MATFIDIATPFTQRWKEYEINNSGVSLWENYLKGVQQTYQPQITAYQQQAAYDISGAFANYKQQQRNILQNQRLETSLQQQLSGQLEGAYQSAYSSATAQAASNLSKVAQAYAKDVAAGEKQFTELGEMSAKAFEKIYEYATQVNQYEIAEANKRNEAVKKSGGKDFVEVPEQMTYDINLAYVPEENGGYGHFELVDGEYKLTTKGKDFYDKILNARTTQYDKDAGWQYNFKDWLRANDYSDVADFYESNYAQFADILGGSRVSDLDYTQEEELSDKYGEFFDTKKTFDNDEKYESYKSNVEYFGRKYANFKPEDPNKWRSEHKGDIEKDIAKVLGVNESSVFPVGLTHRDNMTTSSNDNNVSTQFKIYSASLTDAQKEQLKKMGVNEYIKDNGRGSYTLLLTSNPSSKTTGNIMSYKDFFKNMIQVMKD